MLKGLRLRLALLCVALTYGVFAVLMLVMELNAERQYAGVNELLFQERVTAIVNRLQTDASIEAQWLAETEFSQKSVIGVETNGVPLRFSGAWTPTTDRERLLALAREAALARGLDYRIPPLDITRPTQTAFLLEGERGEPYRCAVVMIPAREGWFSLTVLDDIGAERAHLSRQRVFYGALSAGALLVLCGVSWLFTGQAVRPTEKAVESQRRFVAAASHELKSPLAVIGSTAGAIRLAPERTDELVSGIESECGRLGRLVADLLLLANADTAGWRVNLEPVGVEAALMEVADRYRGLAAEKGFALSLELPEALLPSIQGDAERLVQMFAILIDNALSHSGKPGPILVRASRTAKHVFVEVIDHGNGIPADMREQVFERFSRMDKARTGKSHFGLGLPIVKELARLHRGSVALTETEGGGCTFRLTFPVE